MQFFRSLFFTALLAGSFAGLVAAGLHIAVTVPLVERAETFEKNEISIHHSHGLQPSGHSHDVAGQSAHLEEPSVLGRNALTLIAMLLAYIGFAILMVVSSELLGGLNTVKEGALWGFAGFLIFSLVPAIGLPPELPGMPSADLQDRQIWWVVAAACTALALYVASRGRSPGWWVVAMGLLALPFVLGAPQPDSPVTEVPHELHSRFIALTVILSFVSWLLLGTTTGWLRTHFAGRLS